MSCPDSHQICFKQAGNDCHINPICQAQGNKFEITLSFGKDLSILPTYPLTCLKTAAKGTRGFSWERRAASGQSSSRHVLESLEILEKQEMLRTRNSKSLRDPVGRWWVCEASWNFSWFREPLKLLGIHLKHASANITGTTFLFPCLATKCHVILVDIII